MSIYIPPNCITLDKVTSFQIRLGLQGFPGTGKTWAALTFPNPIVANFDKALNAHIGREEIIEAKFYDADFCKSIIPSYKDRSQIKDVSIKWLETEAMKLTPEQTLVWDGGTSTQSAYHAWFRANSMHFLTKQNKVDDRAEWGEKIIYFTQLCEQFKLLKCNVIFICHESEKMDAGGISSGKIRPLLSGQTGQQIAGHFTDWFRQHAADKPKSIDDVKEDKLKMWKMDKGQFLTMCNSFKDETIYFWQTESDDNFDAKRSSLINAPRFLPANYEAFSKYSKISATQKA